MGRVWVTTTFWDRNVIQKSKICWSRTMSYLTKSRWPWMTWNDMHSKGRRLNLHFRIVIKTQGPLFKPLLHFYQAVSQQQEIVVKRASGNEAGHKLGFTRFYMFYKSFPVCVAMLRCLCVLQVRGVCRMCWSGLVCTISDTSDYVGSHLILFLNYWQFRKRTRNFRT